MESYIAFEIDSLFELNFFTSLDYFFAKSMAKAFHENDSIVLASCALVSKLLSEGHICLDIKILSGTNRTVVQESTDQVRFPEYNEWIKKLQTASMVSSAIDPLCTPLVLDPDHRLYLSKYYDFQNRLVKNIAQRALCYPVKKDQTVVNKIVDSYFDGKDTHTEPQKSAVKNALLNPLTIISGGPGTGKTFVTTLIKKTFVSYAEVNGLEAPKIICVAPTGKAASKMDQGRTIHSVLKPLKNTTGFFYCKKNPLLLDMMIIDEASMVDILLLTRLLEAVPLEAKIIISGDQYQLSSIQAGSVFSDICRAKGLTANLFVLEHNFRSRGKTGIENLSKAINKNDDDKLEKIMTSGRYSDVIFEGISDNDSLQDILKKYIVKGFKPLFASRTIETALAHLDKFKILCAHNSGEYGTLQINHVCEKILRSEYNFDIQERFFKKIIMVNTNDYKKNLFNGETGIIVEKNGERAFFTSLDTGALKEYRVSDLPQFEAAFAITIHKSQGSEFDTVLIIIPSKMSPVMTRQLLYTGVTRAKKSVIIVGNINILKAAMNMSVKRNSGISKALEKEISIQ